MRGAGSNIRGMRLAEPQAQAPECGRATQQGIRQFGMQHPAQSPPAHTGMAQRYADAAKETNNPMRRALLHERAANCLLRGGEVAKSLHRAQEAHALFRDIHPGEAVEFRCRFTALLLSNSTGKVSVEFFDP